jgi:hypothetical protein
MTAPVFDLDGNVLFDAGERRQNVAEHLRSRAKLWATRVLTFNQPALSR